MIELRDKLIERFGREDEFEASPCDYFRTNSTEWVKAIIRKPAKDVSEVLFGRLLGQVPDGTELTVSIDNSRRFEVKFIGKDTMWMRRALEVFECVLSDWEVDQS